MAPTFISCFQSESKLLSATVSTHEGTLLLAAWFKPLSNLRTLHGGQHHLPWKDTPATHGKSTSNYDEVILMVGARSSWDAQQGANSHMQSSPFLNHFTTNAYPSTLADYPAKLRPPRKQRRIADDSTREPADSRMQTFPAEQQPVIGNDAAHTQHLFKFAEPEQSEQL
ncbi:hypothetical protein FOPE_02388 [Fonsecaea pedrosoi]|nr:hypothetical protein FOPE_02388 [Fonsecaea pedrosoi]